jgi:hypothetical protein
MNWIALGNSTAASQRCLLVALMIGSFASALTAADVIEPRPPGPPLPVIAPEAPSVGDAAHLSTEESATKRLRELLAGHDRRIAELIELLNGRSAPAEDSLPGLDDAHRDRDDAFMRAATQAQDYVARRRSVASANAGIAPQQNDGGDALRTLNRLAIADCYRRLVLDGGGEPEVTAGASALAEVDAALLGEADLPTLFYLRTWFLAERARRSTDPEQAAALTTQAQDTARLLIRDFPHSALSRTAQDLVRDMTAVGPPQ